MQVRERRSIRLGLLVSLLVHVLVLIIAVHQNMNPTSNNNSPEPIAVRLESSPAPAKSAPKNIPKTKPVPRDRIIALSKPSSKGPRIPPQSTVPETPQETTPDPNAPPVDMMAMVNAARARRNAQEANAARENAEARANGQGPSENDIAMGNINRNLQRGQGGGTGGVFEILNKGTRVGQFAFNGWTTGVRSNWREVIDVDAGVGGDIELAIVRRMIELIRTHYSGDFNWDSHRLGRVVVMSARPQDTAELEAFMMHEFFDVRNNPRVH